MMSFNEAWEQQSHYYYYYYYTELNL